MGAAPGCRAELSSSNLTVGGRDVDWGQVLPHWRAGKPAAWVPAGLVGWEGWHTSAPFPRDTKLKTTSATSLSILVNPFQPQHISHHLWLLPIPSQLTENPVFSPKGAWFQTASMKMFLFLEKQGEQYERCWKLRFRAPEKICVLKCLANLPQKYTSQRDGETNYSNPPTLPSPSKFL